MKRFILLFCLLLLCQAKSFPQETKKYDCSISILYPSKENSKFYFNEINFKYYMKNDIGVGLNLRERKLFDKEKDFLCGLFLTTQTLIKYDIPIYLSCALGSGYSQQYFDHKKDQSPILMARVGLEIPFWKSVYLGLYSESLTIYATQRKQEFYSHTTIGVKF